MSQNQLIRVALALALCVAACDEDSPNNQPPNDTSTTSGDTSGGEDTSDTDTTPDDTSDTTPDDTDTPDTADTPDIPIPIDYNGLVINEVAPADQGGDWIELYNGTDHTIDLSVLSIRDNGDDFATSVLFPAGTQIIAGGHYLAYLSNEPNAFPGFQLSSDEELALFAPDATLIDLADWETGQAPEGYSFGRIPNGTGNFKTLSTPTPGSANTDNPSSAVCGDGIVTPPDETCDDLNTVPGDGCSPLCAPESGWYCTQSPSVCETQCGDSIVAVPNETCDDGNATSGDGCSDQCRWETAPFPDLVINEVVASPVAPDEDWVELLNTSDQPIDLTGWSITDDQPTANIYLFATSTMINPGEHLVFARDPGDGSGSFGFGLGGNDAVMLFNPDNTLIDIADWSTGEAPEGSSYGRFPNGTGPFRTLATPTPGTANGQ